MTTPERSIEEIVESLAHACFNTGFTSGADDYRTARGGAYFKDTTAFKKMKETIHTLQAERQRCDEMVEAERDRIQMILLGSLLKPGIDDYPSHQVYLAIKRERELQAKAIKALTHPNNPK